MTKCTWDCEDRNGMLRSGGGNAVIKLLKDIKPCDRQRCQKIKGLQMFNEVPDRRDKKCYKTERIRSHD